MYVFIVDRGDGCGKLPFIFTVITLIVLPKLLLKTPANKKPATLLPVEIR